MTDVAAALKAIGISPNEADRNLEPANVVDGLFAIARAMEKVASAIDDLVTVHNQTPNDVLYDIANAIREKNDA